MQDSNENQIYNEWMCQKLISKASYLTDERDWQELANCYTEDALLSRPSAPDEFIVGREKILNSFIERPPTQTSHLVTPVLFNSISDNEIKVVSRVWLIAGPITDNPPAMADGKVRAGSFHDTLVVVNNEWLIKERRGSMTLILD